MIYVLYILHIHYISYLYNIVHILLCIFMDNDGESPQFKITFQ